MQYLPCSLRPQNHMYGGLFPSRFSALKYDRCTGRWASCFPWLATSANHHCWLDAEVEGKFARLSCRLLLHGSSLPSRSHHVAPQVHTLLLQAPALHCSAPWVAASPLHPMCLFPLVFIFFFHLLTMLPGGNRQFSAALL